MSPRLRGCLLEIAETLLLTLVIFLVMQQFVVQPFQIQQQSMEHTLVQGQYVLVDKLSPRWDDFKRGDIVVFSPPPGYQEDVPNTPFIKRVIATAGQTVDIENGVVSVDGVTLDEPYVYGNQPTTAFGPVHTWHIGTGQLFVLGDHRQASRDSRDFGPIDRSTIIGRAWIRYWPLDKFGFLPGAPKQPSANAQPVAP